MASEISRDTQVQVLADHYKDSFHIILEHLKLRERLFTFALILMGLQFLKESSEVITKLLEEYANIQIVADKHIMGTILWFVLLAVVIRYFQTNIHIERQYKYIHGLEDRFSKIFKEKIIFREGGHYLSGYPLYSKWTGILYTWIFPLLLMFLGALKIFETWPNCNTIGVPYVLNLICYFMILISVILYIGFMKFDLVCKIKIKENEQ